MCSLGHHDGPEALENRREPKRVAAERPRRRHTDGSVTRAIANTPRTVLAKTKAEKTAELRADIAAAAADALAEQHGVSDSLQLELVPPDMAQLPPSRFRTQTLPDPSTLYYSGARDA